MRTPILLTNSFVSLWKAILWAGVTLALGKAFAIYQFWIVVSRVFFCLSVPIALGRIYWRTIKQISGLSKLKPSGRLHRLMSGRTIRVTFCIAWALGSTLFMLVQFHTYNHLEWIGFFLVIPIFYGVFAACRHFLAQELKDYLVMGYSLRWAILLTPAILLALYAVFCRVLRYPRYDTLKAAIENHKAAVADMTGSALVAEFSQWLAWYDGVKAFAHGNLTAYNAILASFILAIGSYVVFFNACTMLACFLIPAQEYLRIFGPLSNEPVPPPISPTRIAIISAVITFVALFIYVPAFAAIEFWIQGDPRVADIRKSAEKVVEQIGDDYFNKGTIAKIEEARVEALSKVGISLASVEGEADRAFDRMEGNVDSFLNWYYSLPAEYARILKILTGSLEDYLQDKLMEYLQQGDAFRKVEAALNEALANQKSVQEEYDRTVKKIISENRIKPQGAKFSVVQSISLKDAFNPPVHKDLIDFNKRMAGGVGAGAIVGTVTAVVTKKIVSKIAGKATLKKAAQVLAKVMAGKVAGSAGGAAAGAAAGAAIGSFVPFIGTAIGATIGGIAGGIATGVTVDKLFLMLEEALNRDTFKKELIESIEDARKDFKNKLKGQ